MLEELVSQLEAEIRTLKQRPLAKENEVLTRKLAQCKKVIKLNQEAALVFLK